MKRTRRRYLILEPGGEISREHLQVLLAEEPNLGPEEPKFLPLGPNLVLLRCEHTRVEGIKRFLSLKGVRIVGVSGTIKGAGRFLTRKGCSPLG